MRLSEVDWKRIEDILMSLQPCKLAINKLQTAQLTPGDVFVIWRKCKLNTEKIETPFA